MFDYLRRKILYSFKLSYFYTQKVKRPSAMVYISSNFENSENRCKEDTGY